VNQVLDFLQESREIPPMTVASDWRFKRAWFNATDWSAISDEILEILRLKGRYVVRHPSPEEKRVIDAGKKAGLIRYVRERRAYVPVADSVG